MNQPETNNGTGASRELYPGQHEDLRKRAELLAAIDRAQSAVLPGALREAFAGQSTEVEGHKLRPVNLNLVSFLETIESPLLNIFRVFAETGSIEDKALREKAISHGLQKLKFSATQAAELIFIFTRPSKSVRTLLESGRAVFTGAAMDQIGERLHPRQSAALIDAIAEHFISSWATVIKYGAPPPSGEMVFQVPSPSAVTDSAGG